MYTVERENSSASVTAAPGSLICSANSSQICCQNVFALKGLNEFRGLREGQQAVT